MGWHLADMERKEEKEMEGKDEGELSTKPDRHATGC